jgi:hypothetical protein
MTEADEDDADLLMARVQIEETRGEMSGTINAIQERLNPQTLAQQAKDAVQEAAQEKVGQAKQAIHDATIGKVEGAVSMATDKVQEVAGAAGDTIGGMTHRVQDAVGMGGGTAHGNSGGGMLDTVRRHPLPAGLAAAGIGWLFISVRKEKMAPSYQARISTGAPSYQTPSSAAAPGGPYPAVSGPGFQHQDGGGPSLGHMMSAAPDAVGQVAGKAKDGVSQVGTQATAQVQRARGGFDRLLRQNPLAVGAAVAGIGMIAGLSVPETDAENQLMGQAHDSLMDRAGQMAQDTAQRAQSVAKEALGAAKEEARSQDLLPGS